MTKDRIDGIEIEHDCIHDREKGRKAPAPSKTSSISYRFLRGQRAIARPS